MNGESFDLCVIHEISKDRKDCLVFIEETGEKIRVNFANLKPFSRTSYLKLEESYTNRFFYYNNNNKNQLSFKSSYKRETVKCDIEIDRYRSSKEIISVPMMIKKNPEMGKVPVEKPVVVLKGKPKETKPVPVTEQKTPISFLQESTVASSDSTEFRMILQKPKVTGTLVNGIRTATPPFEGQKIESIVTGSGSQDSLGKINYKAAKSEMTDGSDLPCKCFFFPFKT